MSIRMEVGILEWRISKVSRVKLMLWVSRGPKVRLRSVADGQQFEIPVPRISSELWGHRRTAHPGMERPGQAG